MPRGFVLHPTYRIESGRPIVHLYGRLESGASFLVRDGRQIPRFYVRRSDAARARALGAALREPERDLHTLRGEPAVEVEVPRPQDVPPLRERLAGAGIACYEADVRFAYRYLIDRAVRGTLEIRGEAHPGEFVDQVFDDPEIRPAAFTPRLSLLSFDIETDPQARHVLCVALAGARAREVWMLIRPGEACPPGVHGCASERALLEAFERRVRELDPDVLTGWNVVDFDLAVLQRIAQRHGRPLCLGRGPEPLEVRDAVGRVSSHARVTGRVVLDGIQLLRDAYVRMERYSLDAVAAEILGKRKTVAGPDRAEAVVEMYRGDREALAVYNLNDAELALEIVERMHLVELAVERSRLTGMPPDRVGASIASFDLLYLSELGRRGIVAPTPGAVEPGEPLSGGHVLEPVPGLYRNVLVFDFKSLYPCIIRTFQIDPLGYLPAPGPGDDPIVAPSGAGFRRTPGILPGLLDDLFPRREAARHAGDKVASQAIKILMNSFYGVLGTPACRFFEPALANAITSFGREILLWTKARAEALGHAVLYGDTDSLFVRVDLEDAEKARALGAALAADLNRELREHVARTWRVECRLELQFERLFLKLYLPALRHGAGGARKRYAGLVEEGGRREVVFTGLEAVRRDWTELARRVQRALYQRLFEEHPVDEYLRQVVTDLRAGHLDDLCVYRKALRKEMEEYTAATPPHVAAARKMGARAGQLVAYVITREGPEPAAAARSPIDHEHYVQRQIRPVAEPVLELLGLDFDRVVGDDAQLRLL